MSNKTNTDNNELALTPDNYVGEVQHIQGNTGQLLRDWKQI